MIYNISFSGICFQLQNFTEGFLLNSWSWKMDPWKKESSLQTHPNCVVQIAYSADQNFLNKYLTLLCQEQVGFFERKVQRLPDNDTLWDFVRITENKIYLRFGVSSKWDKIILLRDVTNTQGCAAFEYLAQIMPGVCLKHNLLTFHSALVEYGGQAFAICAPSGTGKTTHARLWRDHKNALILNGDRAVVGKEGERWIAYGTPWSGTSGEQINRHAPLKALVVLERSEYNYAEILEGLQAFTGILPHMLYPAWDREMAETAIDQLNELLCDIPVIRLRCRPDVESVEVLMKSLEEL